MDGVEGVMHTLFRSLNKMIRDASKDSKSVEVLIANSCWPKGGLKQLRGAVYKRWLKWAIPFCNIASSRPQLVTAAQFAEFMSLLFAALYTYAPQGRIGGVQDLCFAQRTLLLDGGVAHASNFKTAAYYGYQPVIVEGLSLFALQKYLEILRPLVVAKSINRVKLVRDEAPLFITWSGKADVCGGERVSKFFRKRCGLAITTTTLRSLMETEADMAERSGLITRDELVAINNVNGHTSETVRLHYLKQDRSRDAEAARNAMKAFSTDAVVDTVAIGAAAADAIVTETAALAAAAAIEIDIIDNAAIPCVIGADVHSKATSQVPDANFTFDSDDDSFDIVDANLPWGEDHPHMDMRNVDRVPWSKKEIGYIGWYASKHPAEKNVMANLLKHLKNNPTDCRIFHRHHTADSARLRAGWDHWRKSTGAGRK